MSPLASFPAALKRIFGSERAARREITDRLYDQIVAAARQPALYAAWHGIRSVQVHRRGRERVCQVVGPVCESGDFLGQDRLLDVEAGELLVVDSAGAYGMSMSSNYNSRARAPEVMIDGARAHLIRSRETIDELFAREFFLPID